MHLRCRSHRPYTQTRYANRSIRHFWINHSHGMTFDIGKINNPFWTHSYCFQLLNRRFFDRTTISGKPLLSCTCHMMNGSLIQLQPVYSIPLTQSQPLGISDHINRPRTIQIYFTYFTYLFRRIFSWILKKWKLYPFPKLLRSQHPAIPPGIETEK